jgi:RNA-directed DNA polymerase
MLQSSPKILINGCRGTTRAPPQQGGPSQAESPTLAERTQFKRRIHELTHRNNPKSMKTIIEELNRYLRGWANYFRIQEFKTLFGSLDDWVRGRLRSMQLAKWKKPKKFQRAMINAGVPVWKARRVWVAMRSWQSANRREVLRVLNADWFRSLGLIFLHDYSAASTS